MNEKKKNPQSVENKRTERKTWKTTKQEEKVHSGMNMNEQTDKNNDV